MRKAVRADQLIDGQTHGDSADVSNGVPGVGDDLAEQPQPVLE